MPSDDLKEMKHYTWDHIASQVDKLVATMQKQGYIPDVIVGVFRGGVIPAAMVQRAFAKYVGMPTTYHLITVYTSSYGKNNKQHAVMSEIPMFAWKLFNTYKNVLIVDDIFDTGETLGHLLEEFNEENDTATFKTAVLVSKQQGSADFEGELLNKNVWAVFPWEEQPDD